LQALNSLDIEWGGKRYATGASIGLAMKTIQMPDDKAWLESADQACCEAKRQGLGRLQMGNECLRPNS
jgi:GGDEF domain-containing protein